MANRWFFDTEFNDTGSRIDLISIGLVSEDGREYYAVSSEFDPERCLPWVKENVLPSLVGTPTKTREQISEDILALVGPNPEFWAYYADYDWVVLCQLYGPMAWLPKSWPMFCMDLKQEMTRLGIEREQLPDNPREHNALEDARWLRDAYRQFAQAHHHRPCSA